MSICMISMSKMINSLKGMACGVLVWFLIFGLLRVISKIPLLGPFWGGLKVLVLLLGPPVLFPLVIYLVMHYQLPPLSLRYIKKNWPLWIPGMLVACVPSVDILFLGKRLIGIITG